MDENTIFALVSSIKTIIFPGSAAFGITPSGITRNTAIVVIPNGIMSDGVLPFYFIVSFCRFSVYSCFVSVSSFSSLCQICAHKFIYIIFTTLKRFFYVLSKNGILMRGRVGGKGEQIHQEVVLQIWFPKDIN